MKTIPITYQFDASLKTVTCTDFSAIEKIAIITNLTTGEMIYQFNNPLKSGTLTENTLTLVYDTTTMSDTDELQIIIHGKLPESDTGRILVEDEVSVLLKAILTTLQMPRNADTWTNSDRVNIVAGWVNINANQTLATLTTLGTIQNFNWQQAHIMSVASEINAWYNGQRSTIS